MILILAKATITTVKNCDGGSLFGLPKWHKYLGGKSITLDDGTKTCTPVIDGIHNFWLIGLALVEILLRVAIIVAIIYIILGGVKLITSRGNADKLQGARNTIIDALTGLAIAIVATAFVAFVGSRFSG